MNPSVLHSLATAASLQLGGRGPDALDELCRARQEGERAPKLYYAIGHLQFEMERYDAAAGTYRELLDLDSRESTAWHNLAVCLERTGQWESAANAFQRAIELDPRRT